MRQANLPKIDRRYWIAISAASVFGCNLGDFISLYLHLGHWLGLCPLATAFLVLIAAEQRSRLTGEAWYWTAVIILRTAATNVADLATHTFNLACLWVVVVAAIVQVLVVLPSLRPIVSRDGDIDTRPAANRWYWASLLNAGVLGTVIGDGMAEQVNLGTGLASLVLGTMMFAFIGLGVRKHWTTKLSYWSAIVAVRAAGTTVGDWLAFRDGRFFVNGLGLGLPFSTTVTGAIFVLTLWRLGSSRD